MFQSVLSKIRLRYKSLKTKPMNHSSPTLSTVIGGHDKDIDLSVSELPANHVTTETSLLVSTDDLPRDQWFGQKYLEYLLAKSLLRDTSVRNSVIGLGVCLASLHTDNRTVFDDESRET